MMTVPRPPAGLPARLLAGLLAGLSALGLPACTPGYSPNTYSSTAVQQASKVEQGVIVGVRKVNVQAAGTTGALTGAAVGAVAGAQVPSTGVGTALTTLGGTLVGGLVGTGIERATGDTTAFEYIVRKPSNEMISVTQKDAEPLALGQKVLVIAGTQARIVADYTVPEDMKPGVPATPTPVQAEPLPLKPSFTLIE